MFRARLFRINLPLFALFMVNVALLAIVIPRLVGSNPGSPLSFGLFEWAMIGTTIIASIAFWAIFPAHAGPDGLRGTDGIGRYHNVRWEEMEKVSNIFGFLWIRHGQTGKALTIPRFMADGFGFREYVRRNAPEGNPLRDYLMNR